jgi:hypothetical protein
MRERGGTFGALAPRHALRPRRGTGGVEHHRPRLGIGMRLRVGRVPIAPFGEVGHRDARTRRLATRCRFRRDVLMEERLRLGVLTEEIEIVGGRAPVHRRYDDAGELAGPVQRRRLPAVLQHGDDMVAGPHAERVETRDHAGDAAVPLRIGQPHRAVDDRERIGVARHAGDEAEPQVKHKASCSAVVLKGSDATRAVGH